MKRKTKRSIHCLRHRCHHPIDRQRPCMSHTTTRSHIDAAPSSKLCRVHPNPPPHNATSLSPSVRCDINANANVRRDNTDDNDEEEEEKRKSMRRREMRSHRMIDSSTTNQLNPLHPHPPPTAVRVHLTRRASASRYRAIPIPLTARAIYM